MVDFLNTNDLLTNVIVNKKLNYSYRNNKTGFGREANGLVFVDYAKTFSSDNQLYNMTKDASDNIYVTGYIYNNDYETIGVAKVLPSGQLDPTFGVDGSGFTAFNILYNYTYGFDIALDNQKRILVFGYIYDREEDQDKSFIARFLPNGELDLDFGEKKKGYIFISTINYDEYYFGLTVDSQDNIYATTVYDIEGTFACVVNVLNTGALNINFGVEGIKLLDLQWQNSEGYDIALDSEGKIIVCGTTEIDIDGNTNRNIFIAKLLSNGDYDTTFNESGYTVFDISSNSYDYEPRLTLDASNNIFVTCRTYKNDGSRTYYNCVKVLPTGTLDNSFGDNGKSVIDTIFNYKFSVSLKVDKNNKIILVGQSDSESNNIAIIRLLPNGSTDSSFGTDGIISIDISNNSYDYGFDVVIDNSNNIIVGGYTEASFDNDNYNNNNMVLVKVFNDGEDDGALDLTYGTDGKFMFYIDYSHTNELIAKSVLDHSGNIIIGGVTYDLSNNLRYMIAKLLPNGDYDTRFGPNSDGKYLITDIDPWFEFNITYDLTSFNITVDNSNNIIFGGTDASDYLYFNVIRISPTGVRDETFTNEDNGKFVLNTNPSNLSDCYLYSVKTDSENNVIVAGYSFPYSGIGRNNADFTVFKILQDGSIDTSFGTDFPGVTVIDIGEDSYDDLRNMTIDNSGNIICVGYTSAAPPGNKMAIVKLLPNGQLDTTFNGSGILVFGFGDPAVFDDNGLDVVVDANNNIYFCGATSAPDDEEYNFAVCKLTPTGEFDTTFGENNDGKVIVDISNNRRDVAFAINLDSYNNIYLAGRTYSENGDIDGALVKLTRDGVLDTTFGPNKDGKLVFDISGLGSSREDDRVYSIQLDSSGNIYLTGTTKGMKYNKNIFVIKFTNTGELFPANTQYGEYALWRRDQYPRFTKYKDSDTSNIIERIIDVNLPDGKYNFQLRSTTGLLTNMYSFQISTHTPYYVRMLLGQININIPPYFSTFDNIVNSLPITYTDGRITTELIELEKKEELERNN
jgi:uncharacterized delta-60 repeat protein